MNGINLDPGLRQSLARQDFDRLQAEANKARLIKRASLENARSVEDRGLHLLSPIKSVHELINNISDSILIALRTKEDSASA